MPENKMEQTQCYKHRLLNTIRRRTTQNISLMKMEQTRAVFGRPMLIHTYHAVPMLIPCHHPVVGLRGRFRKGIFVAWQGPAWKRHGLCDSNTAALCKSNGKETI
jgi:hypothetical protein